MFNFKKLFQSNLLCKTLLIRQQSLQTAPRAKRSWLTFVKGIVYVEVALFIGTYLVWKRMNDSQEFRFYMKNNWPTILEGEFESRYFKTRNKLTNF